MLVFDIKNIKDKSFVKFFFIVAFRVNQLLFALINEDIYNLITINYDKTITLFIVDNLIINIYVGISFYC